MEAAGVCLNNFVPSGEIASSNERCVTANDIPVPGRSAPSSRRHCYAKSTAKDSFYLYASENVVAALFYGHQSDFDFGLRPLQRPQYEINASLQADYLRGITLLPRTLHLHPQPCQQRPSPALCRRNLSRGNHICRR